MFKGLMALAAVGVLLSGCQDNPFNRTKPAPLPDPQAPIRIAGDFFKANAPQATAVEVLMLVPQRTPMTAPLETQIQMASAMGTDCRPLRSGQDVQNIRTTTSDPLAQITLNGPNYGLVVYLDAFGLSMGNQGNHRFVNPTLAALMRRQLTSAGMMTGRLGQTLDMALKKASGQMNLYQPLPAATDVAQP